MSELQKESSSFLFKNLVKASSSKEHSNEAFVQNKSLDINEESLYVINNKKDERKILLLNELNITLDK